MEPNSVLKDLALLGGVIGVITPLLFCRTKFSDVFFAGSDLVGADFTGATGFDPIHFFKTKNINDAKFDEKFKNELEAKKIEEPEFIEYVKNSELTAQRREYLLNSSLPEGNKR